MLIYNLLPTYRPKRLTIFVLRPFDYLTLWCFHKIFEEAWRNFSCNWLYFFILSETALSEQIIYFCNTNCCTWELLFSLSSQKKLIIIMSQVWDKMCHVIFGICLSASMYTFHFTYPTILWRNLPSPKNIIWEPSGCTTCAWWLDKLIIQAVFLWTSNPP